MRDLVRHTSKHASKPRQAVHNAIRKPGHKGLTGRAKNALVNPHWSLPIRDHVRDPRKGAPKAANHVLYAVDQATDNVLASVEQQTTEVTDSACHTSRNTGHGAQKRRDSRSSGRRHVGEEPTNHARNLCEVSEESKHGFNPGVDNPLRPLDTVVERVNNVIPVRNDDAEWMPTHEHVD